MFSLPQFERVCDILPASNPDLEAWLYHFMTENNIEHLLNPSLVASPEQIRFMVALQDDQVYLPCDDETFFLIYRQQGAELSEEYLKTWRFITMLVQKAPMGEAERKRILAFCRYRFNLFFTERMVLPSRMSKRLLSIVLSQSGDPDPFREEKRRANERAFSLMRDENFLAQLYRCPEQGLPWCDNLPRMRWSLHCLEMSRLLSLSTMDGFWKRDEALPDLGEEFARNASQCGRMEEFFGPEGTPRKKVLYIPDVSGAFVFDLALIRSLLQQGHTVMLILKDAFYFDSPTIWDVEGEDQFAFVRDNAHLTHNDHLTKNQLLHLLREHKFLILSDGLSEQLNLHRASVTFARAWKECDVVLAKGRRTSNLLLRSSHLFTRDIICCWRENGDFHLEVKRKAEWVKKFSEQDILAQARDIVAAMRQAREEGKSVMFYSAIIGSIPGQTGVAVELVTAFVEDLRARLESAFVINPAEHFEEGMDGDDLMYMWEYVQRSGLLDVWRFQTVEDIERSFALLGKKMPSVWSGKDSTFSTGCTKEMRIALDEQKKHPEMQIIGPTPEKFFRRRDYGVGKYYDATLRG